MDKKIGIWMDHSTAHLIEFISDRKEKEVITSEFTHAVKEESFEKSEKVMHNKEQHEQHAYYKELGEVIKHYNEVILFGPTDAKVELLNMLRKDERFAKIKIAVQTADKMTEHQQQAFVKDHFSIS